MSGRPLGRPPTDGRPVRAGAAPGTRTQARDSRPPPVLSPGGCGYLIALSLQIPGRPFARHSYLDCTKVLFHPTVGARRCARMLAWTCSPGPTAAMLYARVSSQLPAATYKC